MPHAQCLGQIPKGHCFWHKPISSNIALLTVTHIHTTKILASGDQTGRPMFQRPFQAPTFLAEASALMVVTSMVASAGDGLGDGTGRSAGDVLSAREKTARSELGGSGWYINRTQLNGRKTRLITYCIYIYIHTNIPSYCDFTS